MGTGSPPSFSGNATIEMGDQWFLPGRYLCFCALHGDMIGEVDVR